MKLFLLIIAVLFYTSVKVIGQNDTIQIFISSSNLSEDMKFSATKDDELLLIIYSLSDSSTTLGPPLFMERCSLSLNKMKDTLNWVKPQLEDPYALFLIELDSDKTNFEIDPVLRVYYNEIIQCKKLKNYTCIEQYMGDEDILGTYLGNLNSAIQLKGTHKLDKFDFTLEIK